MLLHSCEFSQPSLERLPDVGEIAVAKVEEQFFQRPPYLHPWMSPCVGEVEPFLVFPIVNDITRVTQWELHLMALHGEDFAISTRCGVDVA